MKKTVPFKALVLAAMALCIPSAHSQVIGKNVKERLVNEKGIQYFLRFDENTSYKSDDYMSIFKEQIAFPEESTIQKIRSKTDDLGMLHEKFQLSYKGVLVVNGVYTLHYNKSGRLQSITGKRYILDDFDTTPGISKIDAFWKAVQSVGAEKYLWEDREAAALYNYSKPEGELVILPPLNGLEITSPRLAYKFDIYAISPNLSRDEIYVDALDGSILFSNPILTHAHDNAYSCKDSEITNEKTSVSGLATGDNADSRYSGAIKVITSQDGSLGYRLWDTTRKVHTFNMNHSTLYSALTEFYDLNNVWTAAEYNNANRDNGALDAHYNACKSYDYFLNKHGLNSYNGAGATIKVAVHCGNNWANAGWDGNFLLFGDGNMTTMNMPVGSDTVGHEFGHAVCSYNSSLQYIAQSGALNESFSDIWAACIDAYAAPTTMDPAAIKEWIIGEDSELRPGHEGLRSMSNPAAEQQPDTYGAGPFWCANQCDPHQNSGIFNHWFYLLAKGGSGVNDLGNSYSVTGIGMTKAAKIAYRLEEHYLIIDSDFQEAYMYGLQAVRDIYPNTTSAENVATINAFYAVGFGNAYSVDTIPPTAPVLGLSGYNSTTATIYWSNAVDNINVAYYDIYYANDVFVTSVPGSVTNYTLWGLTASTQYGFKIRARDNNGNVSPWSNTVTFTMAAMTNYCTPSSTNTSTGRIGTVNFTGAGFPYSASGTAGYENLWSQSLNPHFTFTVATVHPYIITPTFGGSPVTSTYAIYIDLDQDGNFTDAGELIQSQTTNATSVTGSFTMPYTPITGYTRLRIIMSANSSTVPGPCATLTAGQIEDYPLLIIPQSQQPGGIIIGATSETVKPFDFTLYPNPANTTLTVMLNGTTAEKQRYTLSNYLGQVVKSETLDSPSIGLEGLSSGMYLLKIEDGNTIVTKKFIKQ